MATQGPSFPGTVTTESVLPEDDNDWVNPGNIAANDGSEATITAATYDANDISFRLKAQNFGFTIPSDATIDGITVEIEQDIAAGSARDERVQLLDAAGALVGANKATATAWPSTPTIATYGGAADTWTASPTPAMVNDPDFGVVLSVFATAANTDIGVDFIRVTITYTAAPPTFADGDTASFTETFAKRVNDIAAETIGVTETFIKRTNKLVAETVSFTENLEAVKVVVHAIGDSVSFTEGFTKRVNDVIAESVSFTESRLLAVSRRVTDTLGFTESLTTARTKAAADAVDLAESIALAASRRLNETAGLTENLATGIVPGGGGSTPSFYPQASSIYLREWYRTNGPSTSYE